MSDIISLRRPMQSSIAKFGGGNGDGDVYVRLEKWASEPKPNTRPLLLSLTAANHIYCSIIATDAFDSVGVDPHQQSTNADDSL
ncbi:UNVERIFIED_CONTAM: hypothetical protein Sradi_4135000 [Sesamum radiatum]|uniref:Uncharacterized protein n=1 Tax=Sesamum radiatum TaxID=300843 RepID=A0AAW2P2T4_SESRA